MPLREPLWPPEPPFGADETVRKFVPAPGSAHGSEFDRGRHFPAMEPPASSPSARRRSSRRRKPMP